MGLHITLSIHQQDDFEFDDLDALNADLMADFHGAFGELYADMEQSGKTVFDGPFKIDGPIGAEKLLIACNCDGYFEGYENYTTVWGCYADSVFEIISKHLVKGKIVFFIEIEGNPNEFRIITPGNVASKSQDDIRF